jgi:hypothetical protein
MSFRICLTVSNPQHVFQNQWFLQKCIIISRKHEMVGKLNSATRDHLKFPESPAVFKFNLNEKLPEETAPEPNASTSSAPMESSASRPSVLCPQPEGYGGWLDDCSFITSSCPALEKGRRFCVDENSQDNENCWSLWHHNWLRCLLSAASSADVASGGMWLVTVSTMNNLDIMTLVSCLYFIYLDRDLNSLSAFSAEERFLSNYQPVPSCPATLWLFFLGHPSYCLQVCNASWPAHWGRRQRPGGSAGGLLAGD